MLNVRQLKMLESLHGLIFVTSSTSQQLLPWLTVLTSSSGKDNIVKNTLIFDLGGGTFDVSLVAIENSVFRVKAVSGNTHLGGGDFDNRLVNDLIKEFSRKYKKEVSENNRAIMKLRAASERAKRVLSTAVQTSIEIDCLFKGIDFTSTVTRARFEKLNMDLFKNCIEVVDECLEGAEVKYDEIDDVVLVGGSTRIPKVQQMLQGLFNGKELCKSINPNEAVAYGAAVHVAVLSDVGKSNKDIVLVDVTPLSLGIAVKGSIMSVIMPRNTPIPTKMYDTYTTTHDDQTSALISVYAGESTKDNYLLGQFKLSGFPPAPKGDTKINVCFNINVDGILNMSAEEKTTGNRNQISIINHRGQLSTEEIDRMLKEAEEYNAQDEKHRQKVLARNALENYASEIWDALNDYRGIQIGVSEKMEMMNDDIEWMLEWLEAWKN